MNKNEKEKENSYKIENSNNLLLELSLNGLLNLRPDHVDIGWCANGRPCISKLPGYGNGYAGNMGLFGTGKGFSTAGLGGVAGGDKSLYSCTIIPLWLLLLLVLLRLLRFLSFWWWWLEPPDKRESTVKSEDLLDFVVSVEEGGVELLILPEDPFPIIIADLLISSISLDKLPCRSLKSDNISKSFETFV